MNEEASPFVKENPEQKTYSSYEECLAAVQIELAADPRSAHYARVIHRPKIGIARTLLNITIPSAAAVLLCFFLRLINIEFHIALLVSASLFVLYCIVRLKHITIWLIKFYQRIAPDRVRKRCRFEPSCSEYTVQALNKYGFFRGMLKGIGRLLRCRPPHGGYEDLE